jgi:hypothetical protein
MKPMLMSWIFYGILFTIALITKTISNDAWFIIMAVFLSFSTLYKKPSASIIVNNKSSDSLSIETLEE